MIKVLFKVTAYTRQGWDNYEDVTTYTKYLNSLDDISKEKKTLGRDNVTGDFGITLQSYDVEVAQVWEVVQQEILHELPYKD